MKALFPDNSFGDSIPKIFGMLEETPTSNTKTKQITIQFGTAEDKNK